MTWNYSKLNGKIKENYGNQTKFAEALGISTTSLSKKLNGITQFTQKEMIKTANLLKLDNLEEYFFVVNVKEA